VRYEWEDGRYGLLPLPFPLFASLELPLFAFVVALGSALALG